MRIEFHRTGGFAAPAMKRSAAIDTDDLSETDRAHLTALVAAAESAPVTSGDRRPDAFSYKITIQHDSGSSRVLSASDSAMHESVRDLVDWLKKRATPAQ
jgi:hypothetical protein